MNLIQIRYVLEIAKTKSINQAAKNLYVSQPHLSSTIAELERSLNITIFSRTNKGVALTAVGEEFMRSCEYIAEQINYIENLHSLNKYREQSMLTVTGNIHNCIANDIIIQLQKSYPSHTTRFHLHTDTILAIIDQLSNLTINIGLLAVPALDLPGFIGQLKAKHLVFNPIYKGSVAVFAGKNCPLYDESQVTLDRCYQYPLVIFQNAWGRVSKEFHLENFQHIFTVNDKESFFHTIATTQHIGFGIGAINSTSHYVNLELVRLIPLEGESNSHFTIGWAQRTNSPLTPLENEFITLYEKHFKDLAQL